MGMDSAGVTAAQQSPEGGPAPGALRRGALRGTVWTMGGYLIANVIRFVSNLILSRLLFPEAFGLVALVSTFIQGLVMFSDLGTNTAIIQSRRGEERDFLDTAWTISSIRGVLLWLAACLIAKPVAMFYDQPLLAALVPLAGVNALLAGFEATAVQVSQRQLRVERPTLIELAAQILATLLMIGGAWLDRHLHGPNHLGAAWALVGGTVLGGVLRLILTHTIFPGPRNRFRMELRAKRALLHFGQWVFVSTMLAFLAGQADRLLFGKMISLSLLGVYGIAATLAAIPTQAALKLAGTVILPAYSRLVGEPGFEAGFRRVRMPVLLAGATVTCGMIASGPFLIRILYDSRYAEGGWIIQVVAVSAWFQILESTNGAALIAMAKVNWVAAGSAAKLLGMVVLVPVGFHFWGFGGALWGVALSDGMRYVVSAGAIRRQGFPVLVRDLLLTGAVAATAAVALEAGQAVGVTSKVAGFLGAGFAAAGMWAVGALWYLYKGGLRSVSSGAGA